MPQFAYLYFMTEDPSRVRHLAPLHSTYWRRLRLRHYAGGPFGDRTGGLITFTAEDDERSHRAIPADPFVREHVVSRSWLKRWEPSGSDVEPTPFPDSLRR